MLTKYDSILDILKEYITVRLSTYTSRKTNILEQFKAEIDLYELKIRFITDFIEGNIVIVNKRKKEIIEQLDTRGYLMKDDSFDYLLKMPIYTLSLDKIDELVNKVSFLKNEYAVLEQKTENILWMDDIGKMELTTTPKKFTFKKK